MAGDTNAKVDAFVIDSQTGTTLRASLAAANVQGNDDSLYPSVTNTGEVAFESLATNLVSNDTNADSDIFVFQPTVPCSADFNGDTIVDFFDYLDFVDAFSASQPSADFNHDSIIDFFDYLDFVDAFSIGC